MVSNDSLVYFLPSALEPTAFPNIVSRSTRAAVRKHDSFHEQHSLSVKELGGFLAGSYVRWMLTGDDIGFNDIDVWSEDRLGYGRLEYYFRERLGRPVKDTLKALTWNFEDTKIQLIRPTVLAGGRRTFGYPAGVISQFDFTVVAAAYTGNEFLTHNHFDTDNMLRELHRLRPINSDDPEGEYVRLIGKIRAGFGASPKLIYDTVQLLRTVDGYTDLGLDTGGSG